MNIFYRLGKPIIISLVIFIAINLLIVDSAFANNIPAGFGAGTKIATPTGEVAVENLRKGDRVIGYNFETNRERENVVKEIIQHSSLSYYSIDRKAKIASPNLIYVRTIIAPELVRLNRVKPGNKLFGRKISSIVVDSIEQLVEPTNVYQIVLDNRVGNVYANDILLHVGSELPPYFKNQHIDCKPGTPYFKQCANINTKTLPGFLAAFGTIAMSLISIDKAVDKLRKYKSEQN